jgi:anti-sigma B factor antagonist
MYGCGPTGPKIPSNVPSLLEPKGQLLDLYLQTDNLNGRTGVTVAGEVDMSNSQILEDYLNDEIQSEPKDLYLNLAELSFIDSSGLAVLLHIRRLLQSFDRSLVLGSPSQVVKRVLEITGLEAVFEVDTTGRSELSAAEVPA